MKKQWLLTSLVMLLAAPAAIAQYYQPVLQNRITYFEGAEGSVCSMRIDSVQTKLNTVLYPLSNIVPILFEGEDSHHFSVQGNSWFGPRIESNSNGLSLFFNNENDTIEIHTLARLNDSWTLCRWHDTVLVQARIAVCDTMRFLGLVDSVKVIALSVSNNYPSGLSKILNNTTIVLSKNYGLITTPEFYAFPGNFLDDNSSFYNPKAVKLAGLTNPNVGLQNMTMFDVFDFQPGDEIHEQHYSKVIAFGGFIKNYEQTDKYAYTYLTRNNYADSIVYTRLCRHGRKYSSIDSSSYTYREDTLKLVVRPDEEFDLSLPGQSIVTEYAAFCYTMTVDDVFTSKTRPSVQQWYMPSSPDSSVWRYFCCYDGSGSSHSYFKGIGGPYYYGEGGVDVYAVESCQPVYFKKGNTSWGTQLVFTNLTDEKSEVNIKVYPNPASRNLYIQFSITEPNVVFELFDVLGRKLVSTTLINGVNTLDIGAYRSGIYVYRIRNAKGILKNGTVEIK
jgi:hypothetical protein